MKRSIIHARGVKLEYITWVDGDRRQVIDGLLAAVDATAPDAYHKSNNKRLGNKQEAKHAKPTKSQ